MAPSDTPHGWTPPTAFDKVNAVIDMFTDSCSPDLTVYARAAFEAGLEAIISLATFSMDDIIREMSRPKPTGAARGRRHGRGGRKGGKEGKGLLEIGENIGHDLKGAHFLPTATDSKGLHFLWQIDGYGQRAWFMAMAFGVTLDGFYSFSSIIEKSVECGGYPQGIVNYAVNEQGVLGLLGWQTPLMGTSQPQPPPPGWITTPGSFWLQTGNYWALWWGEITTTSSIPVEVTFGFWWNDSILGPPDIQSDTYIVVVGEPQTFVFPAWFGPAKPAFFAVKTAGGNATLLNIRCKVVGRKDPLSV